MLNIISYTDNILKIKENLYNEGHTLISPLQSIALKKNNSIISYNYKNTDEKEIYIFINNLNILINSIKEILLIINNIKNDIKKKKIDNNHLVLYFKNINIQLINSIRNIILSEIKTIAFDKIKIIKNETFMPDEIWKQRIQLIPIYNNNVSSQDSINEKYFILNKKFNNNTNNYVTSNDLINDFKDNNIKLLYNDIILGKLKNHQKIKIKAYYKTDIAINNSKWSPVINIHYKTIWEFYINNKNISKILPFYLSYNIDIIESKNGICVQTDNKNCKNILKKINKDNKLVKKIIYSKILEMEIKSIGQYNSEVLFYTAINILETKYQDFLNKIIYINDN